MPSCHCRLCTGWLQNLKVRIYIGFVSNFPRSESLFWSKFSRVQCVGQYWCHSYGKCASWSGFPVSPNVPRIETISCKRKWNKPQWETKISKFTHLQQNTCCLLTQFHSPTPFGFTHLSVQDHCNRPRNSPIPVHLWGRLWIWAQGSPGWLPGARFVLDTSLWRARRRTRIRQMEALVKGGGRGIWVWIVGERWNVFLRVSRRLESDCFSSSADLVLAEMRGGGGTGGSALANGSQPFLSLSP